MPFARIEPPMSVVAQQFVFGPVPSKRIGVGPAFAGHADSGQDRVVQGAFHRVREASLGTDEQHTPIPHHVADLAACLVVRGGARQVVRHAGCFVNAIVQDDAFARLVTAAGQSLVYGTHTAGDVHLLFRQVMPQSFECCEQRRVAGFHVSVRGAGEKISVEDGMAYDLRLLSERSPVLIQVRPA